MGETLTFFGDLAFSDRPVVFNTFYGEKAHCNLEGPVLQKDSEAKKSFKVGPHLRQSGKSLEQAEFQNFSFSLANNHIMDFGTAGLLLTHQTLENRSFGGAHLNVDLARNPIDIEVDGAWVSIISVADNFFGAAGPSEPGIAVGAQYDDWVTRQIMTSRRQGRIPVVSFHGGFENFMIPAPPLRELFQVWIDAGAEAVIAHHSHVPLPWESYKNKKIYYGLGNFIVDPGIWKKTHPFAMNSLAVDLTVQDGAVEIKHRVIELSEQENTPELVVEDALPEVAYRLNEHFDKIQNLLTSHNSYRGVVQVYAHWFKRTHARKRLLLGAVGGFAPNWLNRSLFEGPSGWLSNKIMQGFGPHNHDIFGPLSTRHLMEVGLAKEPSNSDISRVEADWNLRRG